MKKHNLQTMDLKYDMKNFRQRVVLAFFALVLFGSRPLFAEVGGSHIGNGGDVIVCEHLERKIELFDLFELREIRNMQLDVPSGDLNHQQLVGAMIARVDAINPTRAAQYRDWFEAFYPSVKFTDNDLVDLPDSGIAEIPHGCELVQIAVQMDEVRLPGDHLYTIRKDLWLQMDELNKAALIMHELIYREARYQFMHENSTYARYYLANIFSNRFKEMNLKEYIDLIKLVNFEYADVAGHVVYVSNVLGTFHYSATDRLSSFYPSGAPHVIRVRDPFEIELLGVWGVVPKTAEVKLLENGNIYYVWYFDYDEAFKYKTDYLEIDLEDNSHLGWVTLGENGNLLKTNLSRGDLIKSNIFDFTYMGGSRIQLYDNGRLKSVEFRDCFGDRNKIMFREKMEGIGCGSLKYYPSGNLHEAPFNKSVLVKSFDDQDRVWKSRRYSAVEFYPDEKIKSFFVGEESWPFVELQQQNVGFSEVGFYPDSSVRYLTLYVDDNGTQKLRDIHGVEREYQSGHCLQIREDGLVISAQNYSTDRNRCRDFIQN